MRRIMADVNPYLNTPPTKLKRDIQKEKDEQKKKLMTTALNAWRTVVPYPFRHGSVAKELIKIAKLLIDEA